MAYFTTNLVGLVLPDLYIAEMSPPRRVAGIGTGVVAVIGEFEKGPVDEAITIGSLAQLVDMFGGPGPDANGNVYKGYTALMNKGWQDLRVIRVSNTSQAKATVTLISSDASPNNLIKLDARDVGYYGNKIKAEVSTGTASGRKLTITNERGQKAVFDNVDISDTAKLNDLVAKINKGEMVTATALQPGTLKLQNYTFTGGADGTFQLGDYTGSLAQERGLRVIERVDEVNIVFFAEMGPATTAEQVQILNVALDDHCTLMSNRIAITCGLADDTLSVAKANVGISASDRVVYVYPYLKTFDADTNVTKLVAPNSFVAAKVASLSPHVSPSNKELGGVIGVAKQLTRAELVDLTNYGIMPISYVQGGGFRIRNGRTSEVIDTARWQVFRRRMTDYIQVALARSLYWAVSEPHTKELRRQIRQAIVDFLAELESLGLIGDPNGELPAFAVICDHTNNPAAVVAAGKLYCDVRVRLIAAADFIIIRTEIGEGVITNQQVAA